MTRSNKSPRVINPDRSWRVRIADPPDAAVAAPGAGAAAPTAAVAAPGGVAAAPGLGAAALAPQQIDPILVSGRRSDSAGKAAVAEKSKGQDPAARGDSAGQAAFAKEALKGADPTAGKPA